MPKSEQPLILPNGAPVVPLDQPHNCYFPSGWNKPYSHATVAVILENAQGQIAMVARRPDEPAEGGKLALPGGYVELGQRLTDVAQTEVREETGYLVLPQTLGWFALLDGPLDLPGRSNERNLNVVNVFTARAGQKIQEHDDEVSDVLWVPSDDLPHRSRVAFGHYDIIGMWLRHQEQPFLTLPIMPSEMTADELFPLDWPGEML